MCPPVTYIYIIFGSGSSSTTTSSSGDDSSEDSSEGGGEGGLNPAGFAGVEVDYVPREKHERAAKMLADQV
jgi:hypothetical protein